mmetsp:Transcript_107675/g.301564  ORF Transcript_107675/g.301564 Transcript_107675/m.301564 type:complete len:218 (-) Transcript_107675:98-751(-)
MGQAHGGLCSGVAADLPTGRAHRRVLLRGYRGGRAAGVDTRRLLRICRGGDLLGRVPNPGPQGQHPLRKVGRCRGIVPILDDDARDIYLHREQPQVDAGEGRDLRRRQRERDPLAGRALGDGGGPREVHRQDIGRHPDRVHVPLDTTEVPHEGRGEHPHARALVLRHRVSHPPRHLRLPGLLHQGLALRPPSVVTLVACWHSTAVRPCQGSRSQITL